MTHHVARPKLYTRHPPVVFRSDAPLRHVPSVHIPSYNTIYSNTNNDIQSSRSRQTVKRNLGYKPSVHEMSFEDVSQVRLAPKHRD